MMQDQDNNKQVKETGALYLKLTAQKKRDLQSLAKTRGLSMTELIITSVDFYTSVDPQIEDWAKSANLPTSKYISLACKVFSYTRKIVGESFVSIFS